MDASAPAVMREQCAATLRTTGPVTSLERVRRARQVLAQTDIAAARVEGEARGRSEGYAAGVQTASVDAWMRGAKVGGALMFLVGLLAGGLLFRIFTALGRLAA